MTTEVWFRGPSAYIRECAEQNVTKFAWSYGSLTKRKIDPQKVIQLHMGRSHRFRALIVKSTGTYEIGPDNGLDDPVAIYPTWDYELDDIRTLEEMMQKPAHKIGFLMDGIERPIEGQEHRVVVTNLPPAPCGGDGPFKKIYHTLADMQREYPDVKLHIHGMCVFTHLFSANFASVDYDAHMVARHRVTLPNGKEVYPEDLHEWQQWLELLGWRKRQLFVPRNRCMYNIQSANWAGLNYLETRAFRSRSRQQNQYVDVDDESPIALIKMPVVKKNPGVARYDGDRLLCSLCSIRNTCKFFREGEVCVIPNTEPARLAQLFNSRDPDAILSGLGTLMAANTDRLSRALEFESEHGGDVGADGKIIPQLDPEVTKLVKSMFDSGVTMAKLLAPGRFTPGTKIAVGVQVNGALPSSPQALIAALVSEAESKGLSRDSITPAMVDSLLSGRPTIDIPALDVGMDDEDDDDNDA